MSQIEEGKCKEADEAGTRKLLKGFKMSNLKIHLLTDDLSKLYTKSKYDSLFDIGVMTLNSSNDINESLPKLFKNGAKVHVESADNLCIMTKANKAKYREQIDKKCKEAGLKMKSDSPYNHHMLYEIERVEAKLKPTEDLD